jgi:molecular chaperone DnaK (HSP70)
MEDLMPKLQRAVGGTNMPRAIGIDLGASFSRLAYVDKAAGQPKCIAGPYGDIFCPSVVSVDGDGTVLVGAPAARRLFSQPERTARSVKHAMGLDHGDIHEGLRAALRLDAEMGDESCVRLGDCLYTLPELTALLIRELKTWAEVFFGETVSRTVITVPASFNDGQREAMHEAGRLAGLERLRLMPEPAAAALAYGLHEQPRKHVAVFDLGGSRFEISILRIAQASEGDRCQVIATGGDARLGGNELDDVLLGVAREEVRTRHGLDLGTDSPGIQALRRALMQAKHDLSLADHARVEVPLPNRSLYVREISRAEFEGLAQPILERATSPVRTALADAGLDPGEIDEVVLAGGSTHIPLARRMVEQLMGRRPHTELDPDEVIALGAAVQADILESAGLASEAESVAARQQ